MCFIHINQIFTNILLNLFQKEDLENQKKILLLRRKTRYSIYLKIKLNYIPIDFFVLLHLMLEAFICVKKVLRNIQFQLSRWVMLFILTLPNSS